MEKSKVYFTKDITTDNLFRLYDALGVDLKGKIGVKYQPEKLVQEDI